MRKHIISFSSFSRIHSPNKYESGTSRYPETRSRAQIIGCGFSSRVAIDPLIIIASVRDNSRVSFPRAVYLPFAQRYTNFNGEVEVCACLSRHPHLDERGDAAAAAAAALSIEEPSFVLSFGRLNPHTTASEKERRFIDFSVTLFSISRAGFNT